MEMSGATRFDLSPDGEGVTREVTLDVGQAKASEDALRGLALEKELEAAIDKVFDRRFGSETLHV